MNFEKEITKTLKSNNFLIYVFTEEENRLESILKTKVHQLFEKKIFVWDFIDGYKNNPNDLFNCQQNPLEALNYITKYRNPNIKVFLLKDFHNFLNDISIIRKIKNLVKDLKHNNQYLILCGVNNNIPEEFNEYIKYLAMPLPNKKEIVQELKNFIDKSQISTSEDKETLINSYCGFSIEKIRRSISQLIIQNVPAKKAIESILEQKKEIIKNKQGLEFYSPHNLNLEIGGLSNFKQWLKVRKSTFTRKAYSYGIKMPKGILLVGIQGTGKSISAKIISMQWNLPLFRLDISKMFVSMLGESENRIQNIINICIQSSPCILWIDEIDKIFNQYAQNNDSGTKQRVTNIFLTWLSEKQQEVFIFATANAVNKLPIELLRKGRFDEIFFVDLPNFKERLNIFQIHLKKVRPTTWNKYNIYYLSHITKGFSGAEIEQSIINSMYTAFYEIREFTTKDIIRMIKNIIPLSVIEKDQVAALRKWGYSGKVNIA